MREPNPQVGSTGLRHSDDATDPAQSRGHSRLTGSSYLRWVQGESAADEEHA